ncbi:hypothetical protein GY45DRAFT_1267392 [Cubamyces sp. BRFM 1775]|nr:hypothetical protein GY45DRAFT_1267392 [Cubamyces sp. BRFM 1775]
MADVIDLSSNPFVPPKDGRCLINDLPSELLAHIFTLGWTPERDQEPDSDDFDDVDSDDGTYSTISSEGSEPEPTPQEQEEEKERRLPFNVLVSHVCSRWRAVAIENPLLWSHIRFVGAPPYDRATTYLERAKAAPLAITVDRTIDEDEDDFSVSEDGSYTPEDNDPELNIISGIMDLITPHVAHWQALQIMVSFYPHMHRALEALAAAGPAPLLEVLQLYHYEDTDEHLSFRHPALREQPFQLFGGVAPRLTHVALWGVHLPWARDASPFLEGLTDLELAYHARDVRPSFYEFARILRASPDLRTLTLCLSCPAGTPADWPSSGMPESEEPPADGTAVAMDVDASAPLVLAKLTDLVLAYLEPAYLLSLLPRLALPALTSLALDLEEDDYTDVLAYLASPRSLPHQQPQHQQLALTPQQLLRGPGVAGPATTRSLLSNLTSLKIASLPANEATVRDAYRQLDSLVALNLNVGYLAEYWIDLLFPQPDSGSNSSSSSTSTSGGELYLPRLESLTTTGVDGARMRELVEARAARGRPLKTVLMNQDDDVTDEDEDWLGKHVDRFEYFEGSDEEEDVDMLEEIFEDDEDGDWEDADEDEDEDGFDEELVVHIPF